MSKLNHYGYRGRRLFLMAKTYEYELNVMLAEKQDNYSLFIEKMVARLRKRIAKLYAQAEQCREKQRLILKQTQS